MHCEVYHIKKTDYDIITRDYMRKDQVANQLKLY